MHMWTAKNWMQYTTSHAATTALLLPQNGLRSNLRASNFEIWGSMPLDPPGLACLCKLDIQCNPPSKNPAWVWPVYIQCLVTANIDL